MNTGHLLISGVNCSESVMMLRELCANLLHELMCSLSSLIVGVAEKIQALNTILFYICCFSQHKEKMLKTYRTILLFRLFKRTARELCTAHCS
jgi:hypothetical protein